MAKFSIIEGPTQVEGNWYRCLAKVEGREKLLTVDLAFSRQFFSGFPDGVRALFKEAIEVAIRALETEVA